MKTANPRLRCRRGSSLLVFLDNYGVEFDSLRVEAVRDPRGLRRPPPPARSRHVSARPRSGSARPPDRSARREAERVRIRHERMFAYVPAGTGFTLPSRAKWS